MTQTFLGMAQDLMLDPDAKAAFEADPDGFLVARGFEGLSPDDVADGVAFVAETLPPGPAQALSGPDAEGDALGRLAQVDPGEVAADEPLDAGPDLDDDAADGTGEDHEDEEDEEDEDDDDLAAGTDPGVDPTQLHDDGTGFEPFRDDELDPSFGVRFGNEDVDDASPADHGELPDLGIHL
jgi:hypothetical protein